MSLNDLVCDIKAYLAQRNAAPKPYTWKAEGAEILAKIKRARAALDPAKAIMGRYLRSQDTSPSSTTRCRLE